MKLRIRDEQGNVVKTYETKTMRIKWGSVKEFLKLVDVDRINDDKELGSMAMKLMAEGNIDKFLMKTFPGITQEEINEIDIFEDLVPTMKEMVWFVKEQISGLPKSKN